MLILGIDPGSSTVGYSLLDSAHSVRMIEAGLVQINSKNPKERIQELYTGLSAIIKKHKPDVCAIERLFFVKNVKTGIAVAESRGVILLTVAQADLSIYEYTPLEIKQIVTGSGKADKAQVEKMLRLTMPELKNFQARDDVFDAIAVALTCHLREFRPSYNSGLHV